jgi:two-component system, NtrC family, nitrogen regulation sensor histidine kinase NtrY
VKTIEKHIFLILAGLMLVLAGLTYTLFEREAPGATDEQYAATVQERVREEMRLSANDLAEIVTHLRKVNGSDFKTLSLPTQYPYFIFKNRTLIYWSDYRFVPDYGRVAGLTTPRLIDFEPGRYIVSHDRVLRGTDTLDVVSLVNVFRQYKNSNAYLQSGYNPDLFALEPQQLKTTKGPDYQNIYDNTATFLFSLVPPHIDQFRNRSTPVNTVILASLGLIFLGLYVFRQIRKLRHGRHYETGFALLLGYFVLLRGAMLYVGVPFLFFENDLFNPRFYAASAVAPSLGDLLLNALVVLILALYLVNYFYRSRLYAWLIRLPIRAARGPVSLAYVVLSYVLFQVCFVELNNIYEKSQFTLDITLSISFSGLKIACLCIFICISLIYFLGQHLLASLFLRFHANRGWGLIWLLAGSVLAVIMAWAMGWLGGWLWLVNGLYLSVLYLARFPRVLYTFRYKTSIYLFFAAFTCAIVTTSVVYRQEARKDVVHKKEFAKQLLAENDEFGEFLLEKAAESITTDTDIRRFFLKDTLFVRERIQHRVKSIHLDKYFDRYDIEVLSFDRAGQPLDSSPLAGNYASLAARYQKPRYRTNKPGLYFVNEVGNPVIKQYVSFTNVYQPGDSLLLGFVVLDLRLKNEMPKSVYPELLVDKRFSQSSDTQGYSYAIFGASTAMMLPRMLFGTGSYNYERKMPPAILQDSALYTNGLAANGYQHVAVRGQNNGRTVVVSSPEYPFSSVFSNFSFLFLILVLTVIAVIGFYAVRYGVSRFSLNYSTRIQILLNMAFFLPLLLVIVIILSVISNNYVTNQESNYISNTKNIAANFLGYYDEFLQGKRSKDSMDEELKKIARDADIDINLFNTQGRLVTATRPLMYEGGHLSKFINPKAFVHLVEDKENQILLNESLGEKQYRTAYAGIKAYNGRLLGVLSVPYFYARPDLDRQVMEVIASALSVFTALFLLFLVLSYFASNLLTAPLKLLTQKIRRTNLDKLNEPIQWQSDDEIGLLISEYNRMLVKLEDNKRELSVSEKQSAWREMAKQVAHEIKNPLTPMKLTLQHLQRTLPNADANDTNPKRTQLMRRTFDSLLEQIDSLSDVATSFAEFAKMPMPRNELFEITGVLNKAADLYADDERIRLVKQIQAGPVMVIGDRQLLGRILTNLIINGIQSVPPGRKPDIQLKLYTSPNDLNVEIHDNGAGIPEAIRTKVFLPNFSTKQGGSGLGLAIAKRGIEHAGGNIWFETEEGVGTSFFLTLPLASNPAAGQPNNGAREVVG